MSWPIWIMVIDPDNDTDFAVNGCRFLSLSYLSHMLGEVGCSNHESCGFLERSRMLEGRVQVTPDIDGNRICYQLVQGIKSSERIDY